MKHLRKWRKNWFFVGIPFLCVLLYLGYRYPLEWDLTQNKNNSLHPTSLRIVSKVDKPLTIDLFSPDLVFSSHIQDTIELFQKANKNIVLKTHNRVLNPEDRNALGVAGHHILQLTYGERKKAIDLNRKQWKEDILTNLIFQILNNKEHWIVFLSGHAELEPMGEENRNLSLLTSTLKEQGMQVASLNLGAVGNIPNNTKTLVIADPKTPLLPKEQMLILQYLTEGGNLLWLVNPESIQTLPELSQYLHLTWINGTILDPSAQDLGTPHPAINVMTQYPDHPLTRSLDKVTVFPFAIPLHYDPKNEQSWQASPFLITHAKTFLEKGARRIPGPFTIGMAFQRTNQRIIVIGNSRFLNNGTIHNYGNLALAKNIFNWLNEEDELLAPPARVSIDTFTPSPCLHSILKYGFPYIFPMGYLCLGWWFNKHRHKKHKFS